MKLKSFGCSFIFGTDLFNNAQFGLESTPSKHSYAALIAKKLNTTWECYARPGAGNFEILNHIITEIAKQEPMLCLINWTWIDRYSFINENLRWKHDYNPLLWDSILPVDETDRSKFYYKNLHTQLRDKIESLTVIKTAIDCLQSINAKFIMTWTDPLIWETQWHCPPSVAWLQDQIRPYLTDFEGLSFLEWSRSKGFAISPTLHPLEDAHAAAAELILDNWDHYVRS